MKFGDNLKKLRKSNNLSQEELADKVNVSRQSVSKWETGEAYPEMNNILQLCKIFHCEINSLVNNNMIDLDSLDEEVKMSAVKFKEDKQKKMKGLSKAIYIFARIAKIIAEVAVVGLVIAMVAVPIISNNLKVKDNTIKAFGQIVKYERDDEHITFKVNSKEEQTITDKEDVIAANNVIDYFEDNDVAKVGVIAEVLLVCILVMVAITIKMLDKLYLLFRNLYSGDTPFTMENADHIQKISYLMIAVIVCKISISGVASILLTDGVGFNIGLSNILCVLILFSVSYVFEYGYYIQQDSNGKMYGDVDE